MIKVKSYSEFLDGREANRDTKREYVKYLQSLVQGINDRINTEKIRMSRDELRAIETISGYFEKMAEEEFDGNGVG